MKNVCISTGCSLELYLKEKKISECINTGLSGNSWRLLFVLCDLHPAANLQEHKYQKQGNSLGKTPFRIRAAEIAALETSATDIKG